MLQVAAAALAVVRTVGDDPAGMAGVEEASRMIAALVVLGVMAAILHGLLEVAEKAGLRWWRGR